MFDGNPLNISLDVSQQRLCMLDLYRWLYQGIVRERRNLEGKVYIKFIYKKCKYIWYTFNN